MKYCPLCGKEYAAGDTCPRDGAVLVLSEQPANPLIGQVLKGTYRIEEEIGTGGMGAVFRATQLPLERDVAVKILMPAARAEPTTISRFFQEARLLSRLNHPNVVSIIDFGNDEAGTIFMVMEYLRGRTLGEKVPPGVGLPLGEALHWMREACAGVAAAHRCGLVHRDLKPENLFIAESDGMPDTLKVLDFGIARTVEEADETRLTQAGFLVGTPGFIAPEQIQASADADERSDVYALGAILYFASTGLRPYAGTTPHSILVRQLQEAPQLDLEQLRDKGALGPVIARAMAIDPADRFADTGELLAALDAVDAGAAENRLGGSGGSSGQAAGAWTPPPRSIPSGHEQIEDGEDLVPTVVVPTPAAGAARAPRSSGRRPLVVALALVGLIGLAFAAWHVTRGPGGADAATDGAPVRGVTASEVVVGMSAAFSGPSRELGRGMQTGIETSFREINARGGIHGRTLSLLALDDAYEPERAVGNMIELLRERGVFAVLGNVGTPTAAVSIPLAVEQRVPFVGAFSGADLLRAEPPERYVFNYRSSYAEETAEIVRHFLDRRGIRPDEIAVFAQDDGFGDAAYDGVVQALAARGFDGDVLRAGYRRNTTSIDDAVLRVVERRSELRGIVLAATYRAAAAFIERMVDEDLDLVFANLSFVGSRALAEELRERGGDVSEGVIVTQVVPHFASDDPGVARYRRLLEEHFPAEQPGFVSLEGYLVAEMFAEALRRAGPAFDVESFVDSMESMSGFDLGIGVPLAFGPEDHQASHRVWATVLDREGLYRELEL